MVLLDRHLKANPVSLRTYKTIEEYDEIKPFPNKFILYEGQGLTFELPNPKRFRNALTKLKVSNPEATLKDIVKPSQIKYKLAGIKINEKQLSFDGEMLISCVSEYFKHCFKVNEKSYEIYREFQLKDYDVTMKKINEKRRVLQNQFNHTSSLMENYARSFNKQNNPDELQKKVYHEDIQKYQDQLDYLQKELNETSVNHRNAILDLDAFVQGLSKLGESYDKATYVRKRKIVSLLFSNIIITSEKQVKFEAKP